MKFGRPSVIIQTKWACVGDRYHLHEATRVRRLDISEPHIVLFILFVSLVSQIGDLIISFFKRLSKVKNTGKLLPGHGGLLDRIDGMIFAFPFAYVSFLNFNF